jgi:hypothetical protein
MEIIEIYRMPDEAYNKNEPWGIQNIENVEFDGKDKLPENLKAVLEEYITVTDGTDYWAAVGKNTVDIILNVVKEFIPDFTMEFDEVYRGNLYANVDIDKLIEYAKNSDDFIIEEETINDKLAFEVIESLLRKSSHFKDNIFLELMTEAVNQENVYNYLKIDLEQFIEDYNLIFEPEIIDIDELQYYATDDEQHYHWIKDVPGQQKFNFKYENLLRESILKESLNNAVYKDKMDSNAIKRYIKKISQQEL